MLARTPSYLEGMSLQEFWDCAIARGLFPLAIGRNSKAPIGEGWNTWTVPIPHPGAASVGLRCGDGGLTGFDVDKNNPATAHALLEAFRAVLGQDIPVRRRRDSPRFLIPYYLTDGPVKGRTFTFPDGDKLQLMGGQFVAFGPHAVTGEPYQWENWGNEWPRLTTAQVQQVLTEVPLRAGTSLRFSVDHETCSEEELTEAVPRTQDEWQAGRDIALRYLGLLKQELLGRTEGRGSTIFAITGVLKFAWMHGNMCTREEIENAITEAGHSLDEGWGGRTLGEEISRQELMPVLRGNLIMLAVLNRRALKHAFTDAIQAPTMALRTNFEISLEDSNAELPWLLYQRILRSEVHFFTGHSGAGKSAVVSDMAVCYLTGRKWLESEVERTDGHILWIAAEDDYGTERRVRHLLRQEPNGKELADRFHLVANMSDPLALEQSCVTQVQFMAAMGKRVDLIVLDTWGASGLCFADNDTEAVLKAMFVLKSVAKRTDTAVVVTDHLPLGNADAWQKGNGAKIGNSGFAYRVTAGKQDQVSIDCGKARGAPKAKSYAGRVVSENYGTDSKGRPTTINVFKYDPTPQKREVPATLKLAAMLPMVTATGMDALRSGAIVKFDSVAQEIGSAIGHGEVPGYVINKHSASKMFDADDMKSLTGSGYLRTVRGHPYFAVHSPVNVQPQGMTMPWAFTVPEKFPWQ
jgi:hypothetical protein